MWSPLFKNIKNVKTSATTEQQTKNRARLSPRLYMTPGTVWLQSVSVISHIYWRNAICETLGPALEKELQLDRLLSNNVYNNKYSDDNGN